MKGRQLVPLLCVLLATVGASRAATPPALLNYQGVLRNATDQPLTGSYDMTFRFWSASTGGDEILVDQHTLVSGGQVSVTGGLFNVQLGGGALYDGTGPGTYTSPTDVFRDYGSLWLSIEVGGQLLSPRVRVLSAGYAFNASNLDGRSPSQFLDTSSTTQVKGGPVVFDSSAIVGSIGVQGYGQVAGAFFSDNFGNGSAYVGYQGEGVSASGNVVGGRFEYSPDGHYASVATQDYGIYAYGPTAGAYFSSTGFASFANVATIEGRGIESYGTEAGGYFVDLDDSGSAYVGFQDEGINAWGNSWGGEFSDSNNSGYAYVGYGDRGIWGKGTFAGGTFSHPDNVTFWADVSTSIYKIHGTGTVAFVQNHPDEKDKVVVYAAPEGDEVAVYTRGSARLVGGEARVKLGETFALVANPDVGLTATVTPRGRGGDLYVDSVSPSELVVKSDDPQVMEVAFDYIVFGLRIGFERHPVVQRKERDAFLPDATAFDAEGAADAELEGTSALARFKAMRAALGETEPLDLGRADALEARINAGRDEVLSAASAAAEAERSVSSPPSVDARRSSAASEPAMSRGVNPSEPMLAAAPAVEVSRPLLPGTWWISISESVEVGDVLANDRSSPGTLRLAREASDLGVVGIVAGDPGSAYSASAPLALAGAVVLCKVNASYSAIEANDLLVASPDPGHAMRALEPLDGSVVGKALEPLRGGRGLIKVLVMSR